MKNALTPIRIVRHESAGVCFELAFATPASELRPYVRQFVGWIDHSTTHERRRQVPSANLPLIFNFDAWVHQRKADATHTSTHRTFTAGLHERYTTVEMVGGGLGLQVDFTPLGARLYYDRLDDTPSIWLVPRRGAPRRAVPHAGGQTQIGRASGRERV